jgi:RNAse (barnase) inhibitor barstar
MENWEQLFGKPENSGVYSIKGEAIPDVGAAAVRAGMASFCLDLARIQGKDGFLDAVADTLDFPDYFGSNWDALYDCLTDLSWLEADDYFLVFRHLENFGSQSPSDLALARTIVQDAAAFWKQCGVRFFAFFEQMTEG